MNIRFNYQIKGFRIRNSTIVKSWLRNVIAKENFSCGNISIIFVDDKCLMSINKEFMKHHYYTDVIAFDYSVNDILEGEIYLSIETIRDNARKFKQGVRAELLRVMVHGILHLIGYKDKSSKEKIIMREKEDYYLSYIK